jgi:hypothetical protein
MAHNGLKKDLQLMLNIFQRQEEQIKSEIKALLQRLQIHILSLQRHARRHSIVVDLFGFAFVERPLVEQIRTMFMPAVALNINVRGHHVLPAKGDQGCLAILLLQPAHRLTRQEDITRVDHMIKSVVSAYGEKRMVFIGLAEGDKELQMLSEAYKTIPDDQKYYLIYANVEVPTDISQQLSAYNQMQMERLFRYIERACT